MNEINSAAFEAGVAPCNFTAGRIDSADESDVAHFNAALGRIYITAQALLLSARPQAGHTQPALTLVVEDSADGSSWATVASFTFTASDQQSAAVDSPRAYLRASWADVVGTWAVDVAVKSIATPASSGGSLPSPWTDGGHGNVTATVDDATKTALTLEADGNQTPPVLRLLDESGDEIVAMGGDPLGVGKQDALRITARGDQTTGVPFSVDSDGGATLFSVDTDGSTQVQHIADAGETGAPAFSIVASALAEPYTKLISLFGVDQSTFVFQVDAEGHPISAAITDPSPNLGLSQFSFFLDPTPGATKLHIVALDSEGTPRAAVINLT